jgi:uncharacterized protein YcbK (DUF882 family)
LLAPHIGVRFGLAIFVLLLGCNGLQDAVAQGDTRTISLHHVHTKEELTITYKRNGRYDPTALKEINWLLRDWRRDKEIETDPHLLDLVWEVQREVGATQPIHIISGYRAPETNAMLRRRSGGVAQFSQHMMGRAMDFFIPGVPLEALRNIGLRLQRGGIGFYPTSGSPFVHLDVGNVRHWPTVDREVLARIFPDGRTVHIPSDGQPLQGYALALADIERRGSSPSAQSLTAARSAGVVSGPEAPEKSAGNVLASLLGFRKNQDKDAEITASVSRPAPNPTTPAIMTVAAVTKAPAVPTPLPRSRPAVVEAAVATAAIPASRPPKQAAPIVTASADGTATARPWPATPVRDRGLTESALAYAPQPGPELISRQSGISRAALSAPLPPVAVIIPLETSVAVMQPDGKPALVHTRHEIQVRQPFNDPWLRAAILAPDLRHYMTAALTGAPDHRGLNVFMQKPSSSVTMAFSLDPNAGLTADRFSGQAVVFVATRTFKARTALLQ